MNIVRITDEYVQLNLMKKLLLILSTTFVLVTVCAQNSVNVDNYRFNFTYRDMPSRPQNPLFFYYKLYVKAPYSIMELADLQYLYDIFYIEGQRRTDIVQLGDIEIILNMGAINIVNTEVVERVIEERDRNRNTTRHRHYYSLLVTYNIETKATVSQNNSTIRVHPVFDRDEKLTFKTKEFRSPEEASLYWRINRESIKDDLTGELAISSVKRLSTTLSSVYGFKTRYTTDIIKTINEKNHPENLPFRTASTKLKSRLEAMDANTPMLQTDVEDLIQYYNGILRRYTNPQFKADIRLRYAALYNLCKIYLYLDQPENVYRYADMIYINGHDKADEKRMKEAAQKLFSLLNTSNMIKSRHFNPDNYFPD